jgi:hypothetical protein
VCLVLVAHEGTCGGCPVDEAENARDVEQEQLDWVFEQCVGVLGLPPFVLECDFVVFANSSRNGEDMAPNDMGELCNKFILRDWRAGSCCKRVSTPYYLQCFIEVPEIDYSAGVTVLFLSRAFSQIKEWASELQALTHSIVR